MQSRRSSPMMTPSRKLLLREKVEVRSVEEGFLGSWHAGKIIGCEDLVRVVQYNHLLNDEGSDNLTERVKVSPIVDGVPSAEIAMPDNCRGLIRPLPPPNDVGSWCPHYGQCVDLYHEDAWWEGVIIDHENECDQKRIFFPDMGDEMVGRIDKLRLSKDWDEVTEEWKPRGNWLFLELIDEVEKDWPLPVSVKQIWYEVRLKNGFEKLREWTSSGRYIWRELVLQVLYDNLRITVKQLFAELNSSWDLEGLGQSLLEFSELALDVVLKAEGLFHSSLAVVPFEATFKYDTEGTLPTDLESRHRIPEQKDHPAPFSTMLNNEHVSHDPDEDSVIGSNNCNEAPDRSCKVLRMDPGVSTQNKRTEWKPAVPDMIPGPEFCPDAIDECIKMFRLGKRAASRKLSLNARKHLIYLGWKIEYVKEKVTGRYRYISPDGKLFNSLFQVCMKFDHVSQELEPGSPMLMSSPVEMHSPQLAGNSCASRKLSKLGISYELIIEPDYCPEAVKEYYLLGQNNKNFYHSPREEMKLRALKAKKHLSAIGWSFCYHMKGGKREMRYTSPSGGLFYSLISACKWCVETTMLTSSDLSPPIGSTGIVNIIRDFDDNLTISNSHLPLLPSAEGEACKTRVSRKKRKHDKSRCIEGSQFPKRGRKSSGSMKLRRHSNADSSTPVRRSSKRARDISASPSQQTPQTVLSWLIDNNVVLPRAKVYYHDRNNGPPLAEGRIAREGIKCSCCGGIFSLCKFEVHAGSTNHKPSANIVLEDGRSLLDCQFQLKKQKINRVLRLESREVKGRQCDKTNDYICSICHYGGELILCDQCPSSFHTQCLGLKGVPKGDWFCPPCCCQICGQSRFDKKNGSDIDTSVLICGQCEQRYHVECLESKGIIHSHPERSWFCKDTCEQIFIGLRKILRKPFPVGTGNLTWTLVKYINSDCYDHGASDDGCLVEDYSKLNVALNVMHECFEPVKEPTTRRDLVEDVIFSRWSELHRMNFQGFYTVLLEKNDELISAATVRIYGKRVAEVPLVATRFQYRRLGMCRILMDELEKKLMELGVERLVLPAVPTVLNTWTTSFGFSVMTESERLEFLDYTFLDFQGTVFCQKALKTNPSSVASSLMTGTQAKSCDHVNKNVNIEETDIVEKASTCSVTAVDNENGNCAAQSTIVVDRSTPPNCSPSHSKISLECPLGVADIVKQAENKNEGIIKCYKRRRSSAC